MQIRIKIKYRIECCSPAKMIKRMCFVEKMLYGLLLKLIVQTPKTLKIAYDSEWPSKE